MPSMKESSFRIPRVVFSLRTPLPKNSSAVAPERAPEPRDILAALLTVVSLMPFAPPEEEIEVKLPANDPVVRSSAGPLPVIVRSLVVSVPKVVPLMALVVAEPVVRTKPRTAFEVPALVRVTMLPAAEELIVGEAWAINGRGAKVPCAGAEMPYTASKLANPVTP